VFWLAVVSLLLMTGYRLLLRFFYEGNSARSNPLFSFRRQFQQLLFDLKRKARNKPEQSLSAQVSRQASELQWIGLLHSYDMVNHKKREEAKVKIGFFTIVTIHRVTQKAISLWDGFLSLDIVTVVNLFRQQSIFVDKANFTDDAFACRCFCYVNELLDITGCFTVGVHKEWTVDRISAVLDCLDFGLDTVNKDCFH